MNVYGGNRRKIWVISDTHLKSGQNLPDSFVNRVGREDIIIHLGDFINLDIVDSLERLAALEAVSGNCDPQEVQDIFPSRKIIEIDGIRVAMTHGSGAPSGTVAKVRREFEGKADVALFGHTHVPCHFKAAGTLFFNPGSLTQGRGNGRGFGLLRIDDDLWIESFEI